MSKAVQGCIKITRGRVIDAIRAENNTQARVVRPILVRRLKLNAKIQSSQRNHMQVINLRKSQTADATTTDRRRASQSYLEFGIS